MFGKGRKRTHDGSGSSFHSRNSGIQSKQRSNQQASKKKRTVALGEIDRLEEQRLEKLVFGNASDVVANLDSDDGLHDLDLDEAHAVSELSVSIKQKELDQQSSPAVSEGDSGVDEGELSPESQDAEHSQARKEPVWMDEDDDNVQIKDALQFQGRTIPSLRTNQDNYSGLLKHKFEAIVGTPRWAELSSTNLSKTDADSDEEELMQHSGPFLRGTSHKLHKGMVELKHIKDLNSDSGSEGHLITSTEFHSTSTVSLVAGLNGAVSVVQVDGKVNTKLQTVQFERFPVRCAHFSHDGTQFIAGSQYHGHFYVYDMMEGRSLRVPFSRSSEMTCMKKFSVSPDGRILAVCGRFGHIHLLTAHSKEWVGTLKMNAEVKASTFSKDGSRLYSHGEGGEVYIWDMNSRECLHRFTDDGCIVGTSIAVSPSGQYLACGSSSGVVNIYEGSTILGSSVPRPVKIALNLVTPVTSLIFNSSSEVLAMASVEKDNAAKLMHFPSMTVFSNFPVLRENMSRVQCIDFSPGSGFLSVGNNRGRALLYRLMHYKNY